MIQVSENLLKTYFEETSFKKNEFLTKEGEIEKYIYYISSGIVRFVSNTFDEKEYTFDFGISGDFVNSYNSYKNNCKSEFSIQAISKVQVFYIDKKNVEDILKQTPDFSFLMIEVLEELLIKKSKRELALIKYSAQEIYQQLINQDPYLIKNIPLKYLASYIGVTPQALSRIRRQIY
ncbi:Crp/Fnr family transcriptional regulator [Tenacibaculum sp. UWU-22]|uniref:Crp/Fnr family transcriptional regulator n=1 Tax=Tenacibaculum sp. UWU-22 TaxID=3234187 RepID=UPI0034DB3726